MIAPLPKMRAVIPNQLVLLFWREVHSVLGRLPVCVYEFFPLAASCDVPINLVLASTHGKLNYYPESALLTLILFTPFDTSYSPVGAGRFWENPADT